MLERFPFQAALKICLGHRGVAIREDVRGPLRTLTPDERAELETMARIVVAGAGAIGAEHRVPPRSARRRRRRARRPGGGRLRRDRQGDGRGAPAVLDRGGGAACAGVDRLLRGARRRRSSSRWATSFSPRPSEGLAELEARAELQRGLGVPVESVDASLVSGLNTEDVLGAVACWEDGVAEPAEVTRELVKRAAALGVEVREHVDARELEADVLVIAAGARSPDALARASDPAALPPARRRRAGRVAAARPADGARVRDRLPLPPPRRDAASRDERADAPLDRPRGGRRGARRGLARPARASLSAGRGCAGGAGVGRVVRHDARRAPDHRLGRRGRVRRVRLLGTRVHAVAGGRQGRRRGAARRFTRRSTSRPTGSSASRTARSSPKTSSSETSSSDDPHPGAGSRGLLPDSIVSGNSAPVGHDSVSKVLLEGEAAARELFDCELRPRSSPRRRTPRRRPAPCRSARAPGSAAPGRPPRATPTRTPLPSARSPRPRSTP